jgi:hypothetical protein
MEGGGNHSEEEGGGGKEEGRNQPHQMTGKVRDCDTLPRKIERLTSPSVRPP